MVSIMIDELDLLDMLIDRVCFWTDDEDIIELYKIYYGDLIDNGVFHGAELGDGNIMAIVDNDYVNWTSVYSADELDDEELVTDDRLLAEYNGFYLVYTA